MLVIRRSLLILLSCAASSCAHEVTQTAGDTELLTETQIRFQPLNPARGDKSPQAGVLWGDITKDVPSGALIRFVDGFSSPPHIHNITYRGVVISGRVHNDDPDAENLWMSPGSFWTQPAGEVHITSAAPGSSATAFLEILEGPYLVQPAAEAFDNGERPINIAKDNIVWLDAADISWASQSRRRDTSPSSIQMAFLWGDVQSGQRNGSFLKLAPKTRVELRGSDAWLRAVVIQGETEVQRHGDARTSNLSASSYFAANGGLPHEVACESESSCLIYVSTRGKYMVTQR